MCSSASGAVLQLPEEIVPNILPGHCSTGIGTMSREAVVKDPAMPVWYRDDFRVRDDAIPQRVDVVDLLIDRKVVEAGRDGEGARHNVLSTESSGRSVAE